MRYLHTFLLLFCFSFLTLTAQDIKNPDEEGEIQGNGDLVDQVFVYLTNGDSLRITLTYNSKGNYTLRVTESLENGEWIIVGKGTRQFDINENLISDLSEEFKNNELTKAYRETHSFNFNGKRLLYMRETWNNGNWMTNSKSVYTFDLTDSMLTSLSETWENGRMISGGRSNFTYDIAGNLIMEVHQDFKNGSWRDSKRKSYTYDEKKKVLTELDEDYYNNRWTNSIRKTYTYDKNNYNTSLLHEQYYFNSWHQNDYETNAYDDKGHILSYSTEYWDQDGGISEIFRGSYVYNLNDKIISGNYIMWSLGSDTSSTEFAYTYDVNGNLIATFHEYSKNSNWDYSERTICVYDQNGKIISKLNEKLDTFGWTPIWRETYINDQNGNNVLSIDEYYDNGKWIIGGRITRTFSLDGVVLTNLSEDMANGSLDYSSLYTYDFNGNMLSYVFEQWYYGTLKSAHRTNFTYDPTGNMFRVTKEEKIGGKWVNKDDYLTFKDSRKQDFSYYGYKVEVTYKTISPVKENIFDANLFFTCFPTPTTDQLNINYTLTEPAITSISISDISGIEVANISNNQMQLPGSYTTNYDASKLIPGTYFITLSSGNKSVTRKIIINY